MIPTLDLLYRRKGVPYSLTNQHLIVVPSFLAKCILKHKVVLYFLAKSQHTTGHPAAFIRRKSIYARGTLEMLQNTDSNGTGTRSGWWLDAVF